MRVLKVAGLALIVVMLAAMWQRRVWVTSAYTSEPDDINFEARGVDLSFEPTVLGSASFALVSPPALGGVNLPHFDPAPVSDSVEIFGGRSTLGGSVVGPDGPLAGATVVLERFVETRQSELRLQTDEFGSWSIEQVHGGVYRIRAFLSDTLVSPPSEVLFVSDGDSVQLDTALTTLTPSIALSFAGGVDSNPGQDQTVAVVASTTKVEGEGRIVTVPVAGTPVVATVSGTGTLVSSGTVLTDVGGAARFLVRCNSPGTISVRGVAEGMSVNLVLPACVQPPPPEPESEPDGGIEPPAESGDETP